MTNTIKRSGLMALILLLALMPAAQATDLLSYAAPPGDAYSLQATLYFRYRNTPFLGQEVRTLSALRTQAEEMVFIQALLDGPGPLYPDLAPLFPPGTQVLSVQAQEDTLFVTFSEALLHPYADETTFRLSSAEYGKGEGGRRRSLAMASLVNTLTEHGTYRRVQVLVRGETTVSSSMRLSNRYYLLQDEGIPDPLLRDEQAVLTPNAACGLLLTAWQTRDFAAIGPLCDISPSPQGGAANPATLFAALEKAPELVSFAATPGTVSPDGASCIVCLDLEKRQPDGSTLLVRAYPLLLLRRAGVWQVRQDTLLTMMGGAQ